MKNTKPIVIFPNLNSFSNFMLSELKKSNVKVIGYYKYNNLIIHNLLRFFGLFNLSDNIFRGEWKKIKNEKEIIIFDECANGNNVLELIRSNNPKARCILYLWNTKVNSKVILRAQSLKYEIYSFDLQECQNHNYKYNEQFYLYEIPNNFSVESSKFDIFFCGYNKGRLKTIIDVCEIFNEYSLTYKVIIREWISFYLKTFRKYKFITLREIKYKEIIEYIKKSKCIMDIVTAQQTGLTIRCMEALFYNKKLITNNKLIKKSSMYNKNNIFILGEDPFSELKNFINSSYVNLPEKIKIEYTVNSWLNRFKIEEYQTVED